MPSVPLPSTKLLFSTKIQYLYIPRASDTSVDPCDVNNPLYNPLKNRCYGNITICHSGNTAKRGADVVADDIYKQLSISMTWSSVQVNL